MEARFEVQTTVTKDLAKLFAQFNSKSWPVRIKRLLLLIAGIYDLYHFGFFLLPENLYWGFYAEFFLGLCGFLFIFWALLFTKLTQWSYQRDLKPRIGSTVVHSFYDDHHSSVIPNRTSVIQYADLIAVVETKTVFGFRHDQSSTIILPKASFTIGTPDDFRAFIEEKTGKKIKFIR